MNSNKKGVFSSKEEILQNLKENNDRKHLSKLMTLIAIKIEEKFTSLGKAFLFFDSDGNREINLLEFSNAIEKLRVKLSKADLQLVFNTLDTDGDGMISYNEFCEFTEEKRRNIDPFDGTISKTVATNRGLTDSNLKDLSSKNPYSNMSDDILHSISSSYKGSSSAMKYADLESQAEKMRIINNG
jgi:hypothetical protein